MSPTATHTSLTWRNELAQAVRSPAELLRRLQLPDSLLPAAEAAARQFPLLVPESYLGRMQIGNPADPLLLQVLPTATELDSDNRSGRAEIDPVDDASARIAPGLLQKYQSRALLIATGTCAVHCRYCFRRHYPYGSEPRSWQAWQPALEAIRDDRQLQEVILSGGDPLVLSDGRLTRLLEELDAMPHLRRIRIHSRLPIVLPSRMTAGLLEKLGELRLQTVLIVHANHPQEIQGECAETLRQCVRSGLPVLNQAVLLAGINDSPHVQQELWTRLADVGVLAYYLHQLDRVEGALHFEVPLADGRRMMSELRAALPGYAVPRYVREIPGEPSKTDLERTADRDD